MEMLQQSSKVEANTIHIVHRVWIKSKYLSGERKSFVKGEGQGICDETKVSRIFHLSETAFDGL